LKNYLILELPEKCLDLIFLKRIDMHYYSHNIGDYRKDTSHLTLLEHGIYRQLLDTYYLDEQPLSNDLTKLMRSHSVRNADEQQSLQNVLTDFFELTESGYIHKRCDAVIADFHGKSEKARASANARWANKQKGSKQRQSKRNTNALQTQSESNPNGMLTNNHKPLTNIHINNFELFWKVYPRHENKIGAMKSWKKVDVELDVILKAVEKHKQSKQWKDGIYPHASTWLNQRRWEDEILVEKIEQVSFI
jgi:uncharacterized protein YdaU (DUF1376 family)